MRSHPGRNVTGRDTEINATTCPRNMNIVSNSSEEEVCELIAEGRNIITATPLQHSLSIECHLKRGRTYNIPYT